MMNAVERDRNKEKKELFFAISQISSRGLLHSAKWFDYIIIKMLNNLFNKYVGHLSF